MTFYENICPSRLGPVLCSKVGHFGLLTAKGCTEDREKEV